MEQQLDAFTQKRFELMVEMATKKLQHEIESLKVAFNSLNAELNSMKSQVSRIQFQPQQSHHISRPAAEGSQPAYEDQSLSVKKETKIVDCRPDGERTVEFVSGSSKNSEPIRPRFGDYKSEDVSIDKFFYFGRK
ncbi:MAG TPA: hypothetical protein VJJ52_05050 [Candidatus Nanoarchaeia archaeon]|nr:hypothetical protein [Candidatus Nanoarchaeia archaeon]